jgi:pilus assembly protein CpaF
MDFGILEPILQDKEVMEILINGHQTIFYEKKGQLLQLEKGFESEEELLRIIEMITLPMGHRLNESNPIIDVRLEDGSRVHIVGRPISLAGPSVTIRKFLREPISLEAMLGSGTLNQEIAELLKAAVENMLNIAVIGGSGSGKTAMMQILCEWINPAERIITIEQASELILNFPNIVSMETRPPNVEGRGEITTRQLVQSATKMRPERILLNALQGSEALDMIQAINMGHDGSIFNMTANGLRDMLGRLELLMAEGNPSMPILALREHITTAIDLVVVMERSRDGGRRIKSISEIVGMNNGIVEMQDIFIFEDLGSRDGTVKGQFTATGRIPRFLSRLPEGRLPLSMFNPHG